MRSAIDTNIALYAFADLRDERKTSVSRSLVEKLAESDECVLSTQVLKEFAHVCTKRLRPALSEAMLLARVGQLSSFNLVQVDHTLVLAAIRRHYENKISFYDALIVEAALTGGAELLYTEDMQHGTQFGALRVVNPFL
jgi:predicted nucleic acid-binding protein